jgi:flagellar motor protein MotB
VEAAVDHLQVDPYGDESVAWPSYVDFLATFSFVLFIFIGSLLYLMYGQLGNRLFAAKVAKYVTHLKQQGIEVSVEGQKIKYDLRRYVDFEPNSAELTTKHKEYLQRVARVLPDGLQAAGDCKIVVLGKADAAKFKDDPFGNWNLSAKRALAVLRFLYNCPNCGYGPEMRGKLVLLGEGDVESKGASADDRRVDLVIDCTREVPP